MALKTVAEWTGSAIISSLIGTAFSYLGEHMLPADIEVELNRLNAILPKITAVLSVAEVLKFQNPNSGAKEWLEQFRLAFQVAEDVLDELKYKELEQMVKNRDQVGGSFSSIASLLKRKRTGSIINKEIMGRLREAVKMLDQASNGVGHFNKFVASLDFCVTSKVSSRETTSILSKRNVVGRESEKAMIIEWLKRPTPHAHISDFCIVGAGGLGKTTLAQLLYEDM
ncbi:Disease resistance protein RGA2 [Rhynchospora pubera]|uniref:Disease resistance protein RGA2 n=1 Tax=Rhynchospora pubera TaxID=906938 RepID=A0AAV8CTN5_9POAL|nr:Disease resistance protein RGA2 [Rhynchospora pubera]